MSYTFYHTCVDWPETDVHAKGGLVDMIDSAITITRGTFRKHVDGMALVRVERALGYDHYPAQGLYMENDWHVSYHRSRLHGERVYFFKHSAIEYVFTNHKPE